jgi:hypothetical protein
LAVFHRDAGLPRIVAGNPLYQKLQTILLDAFLAHPERHGRSLP